MRPRPPGHPGSRPHSFLPEHARALAFLLRTMRRSPRHRRSRRWNFPHRQSPASLYGQPRRCRFAREVQSLFHAEELVFWRSQPLQRFFEILRKWRFEVYLFACCRMNKTEFPSMKHLARGRIARQGFESGVLFAAVNRVADQRVADVLEVNANLMRAARMEAALNESGCVKAFDDLECRPGFARVPAFAGGHAFAVGRMPRDADLDLAAFRR